MLIFTKAKTWAVTLAFVASFFQSMTFAMPSQLNVDLPASPFIQRAATLAPNARCQTDSQCTSGTCKHVDAQAACERMDPEGSPIYCFSDDLQDTSLDYCQQFPLNHTCANQGECRNGLCSSQGICVPTQVGQACKYDLGCSGSQVCPNGTCTVPTPGSLLPLDACKVNASCASGRCVTSFVNHYNQQLQNNSPVCDYFAPGQKGCRTTDDCTTGYCQNSTCKQSPDGARCNSNAECVNLCGLNGVCYKPKSPQSPTAPCKTDTDCQSANCPDTGGLGKITRPDYKNPGQNVTAQFDRACTLSVLGRKCTTSNDCYQGNCVSGVCTGKPLNSICSKDKDCTSNTCIFGFCAVAHAYIKCSNNIECYSNSCSSAGYCVNGDLGCTPVHCQPNLRGGKCRRDDDCESFNYCFFGTCTPRYNPGK